MPVERVESRYSKTKTFQALSRLTNLQRCHFIKALSYFLHLPPERSPPLWQLRNVFLSDFSPFKTSIILPLHYIRWLYDTVETHKVTSPSSNEPPRYGATIRRGKTKWIKKDCRKVISGAWEYWSSNEGLSSVCNSKFCWQVWKHSLHFQL